jgi:hypothetical protein
LVVAGSVVLPVFLDVIMEVADLGCVFADVFELEKTVF